MNILYLHSHDTGRAISPYGFPVPTPNLERFAREGVLFRKAFCAGPTCSPSRAALLTGMAPHSAGMLGLAHRGFAMPDYSKHLARILQNAGYLTVLAGVQHVIPENRLAESGYSQIIRGPSHHAKDVAPAAEAFLKSKPAEPFFLDAGFFETHRDFPERDPDIDPRYVTPPPFIPDTPETRKDMSEYLTCARNLDRGIGRILAALDENGMHERTMVMITTDHGLAFPRMKCNLEDSGTGVLLMMRGPGLVPGKVTDALVSHIDLFPTLCDFTGIPKPDWLQGRSLAPILSGEAGEVNEEIFSEVTFHSAYEPQRSIRTHRYKYIQRFGERRTPVLSNMDESAGKKIWVQNHWGEKILEREYLYDLVFDPGESRNMAGLPQMEKTLLTLRERLRHWMDRTKDPLLTGAVPLPAGALVNDPDDLSCKIPPKGGA